MYNDNFDIYPRKINGFVFTILPFLSGVSLSIWSFVDRQWGESLVLPTNDSTIDVGTKVYYGLHELCILSFGAVESQGAQCSSLAEHDLSIIDPALERDVKLAKIIIAVSIALSLVLLLLVIHGSIECWPHKLSSMRRHLLFLVVSSVDFLLLLGLMIVFTLSRRENHQEAIGGGDSFGTGFIISWISLLFKFNGIIILTSLLHFEF